MFRNLAARHLLLAGALSLALALPVRADAPGTPDTGEGIRKMIAYASCAVHVFISFNWTDAGAAAVGCLHLYLSEPN